MNTWHPSWWNEAHTSTWERVKEAMRRDWEQTKHDFSAKAGHHLHQDANDTVAQATGVRPIPPNDQPNPPHVIGEWNDAETPLGYGYVAHQRFGNQYPTWNELVESELRKDWEGGPEKPSHAWADVAPYVRRGWDYNPPKS